MEQVFKVGFINSTQQLLDCALSAAAKLNINMATSLAGLDAAVPAGLRMEQEGGEVIISRRGIWITEISSTALPVGGARTAARSIFKAAHSSTFAYAFPATRNGWSSSGNGSARMS